MHIHTQANKRVKALKKLLGIPIGYLFGTPSKAEISISRVQGLGCIYVYTNRCIYTNYWGHLLRAPLGNQYDSCLYICIY